MSYSCHKALSPNIEAREIASGEAMEKSNFQTEPRREKNFYFYRET